MMIFLACQTIHDITEVTNVHVAILEISGINSTEYVNIYVYITITIGQLTFEDIKF